jgi:hypothetical protein
MAPLPAQPLMEHLESLTDRADLLAFPSLARTELSDVPGLAGWNGISGQASQASRALGEGIPRPGTTRALLAGAALAAFEAPERAGAIDRALHASLAGKKSDRPGRGAERPAPQRRRGWDATRVTEALLFGELLLEPRSGRSR